MRAIILFMAILLGLSIIANIYLYSEWVVLKTMTKSPQQTKSPLAENTADTNRTFPSLATSADNQQDTSRQQQLDQFRKMLRLGEYAALRQLLREYLHQHPDDGDFLLLEAELVAQTEPMNEAIEYYYSLLDKSLPPDQQRQVIAQIQQLGDTAIEKLYQAQAWDILAMFSEPLFQLQPDNRNYILALATAYAQLQQESLMEGVLASLPTGDKDAVQIRKLIRRQPVLLPPIEDDQPAIASETGIALLRQGDQYIVDALLDDLPLSLLIDTGASATAISQQAFAQAQRRSERRFIGRFVVNTAGGQIVAPMFEFNRLRIDRYEVRNTSVLILPEDVLGRADGLLGMNFLREFDFQIDQRNSQLFLSPYAKAPRQ